MSANNDMRQTINDLYEIQNRWDKYLEKKAEYDNLEAEKEDAQQKAAKKWVAEGEKFDKEARKKLPKIARPAGWSRAIPLPVLIDWEKPKQTILITAASRFISSYGFLAVIALMFVVGIITTITNPIPVIGDILRILLSIIFYPLIMGIFVACFVNVFYLYNEKNKENFAVCLSLNKLCKENEKDDWSCKFNEEMTDEAINNFYKEFQKYDAAFLSYVDDCKKKAEEIVSAYGEECDATSIKYLEAMNAKLDEMIPMMGELENNTVLHIDYVPYAARLARLIGTGRADTIKEAINLMLDEIRKDKEEAERRNEARRQEEETRRHNMAMQRVAEQEARDARAHNAAMEKAARDQAAAAKAQADAAKAQAAEYSKQVSNQCAACKHCWTCTTKTLHCRRFERK